MNYYMLECHAPAELWYYQRIGRVVRPRLAASWITGRRFEDTVQEPIEVTWDPETEGPRKYIYDVTIQLYHRDVCGALLDAGVDNIDMYRAIIVDPRTGETCEEYRAVNVIGLVAAADLGASSHTRHNAAALLDTDFDSLALDLPRVHDLLMFRLAECATGVVIAESVKKHIEARARNDALILPTFVRPEDWLG